MPSASDAVRSTKSPGPPKPRISGTKASEPVARMSRSNGSRSPVPSTTSPASRSISCARVLSQQVMRLSSYQASGSRWRPTIAERP